MEQFSAKRWEREFGSDFLIHRQEHDGSADRHLASLIRAIEPMVRSGDLSTIATRLPAVLTSCDDLTFESDDEVLSYVALHLGVRYLRVTRSLEALLQDGSLPLRVKGTSLLEVGAGPAPSAFAAIDFYGDLATWAARQPDARTLAVLDTVHTLDRGPAWEMFVHHLAEMLDIERGSGESRSAWPYRQAFHDLQGLDVRSEHQATRDKAARSWQQEMEEDGTPITMAEARRATARDRLVQPSAYDLICFCNFLTTDAMPSIFERELTRLAHSLTPGGVFLVLGSTDRTYGDLYADVTALAVNANLEQLPMSGTVLPTFASASEQERVGTHIRGNVASILQGHPGADEIRADLRPTLFATDPLRVPPFRILAFARRTRRRSKRI